MVLHDLPDLYPGLTRAGVEEVLRTFEDPPLGRGKGMASHLIQIAPVIAERLESLDGAELDRYADMMKSAAVLVLQMWTSNAHPPPVSAIVTGVEALDDV